MFDFFQIIDFNTKHNIKDLKFSFLKSYLYDKVSGVEYFKEYKNSKVCYMEREKTDRNFFCKNGKNIFLFGTVFTNNLYSETSGQNPQIVYAEFLNELSEEYGNKMVKYIKGSFVIVIYDELRDNAKVISDRLNVLPLYYSFKDNLLIISSSVRMMLESGFVSNEYNELALIQQLIFDYTLGTKTFFKNIFRIDNGTIYLFGGKGKEEKKYWCVEELYNEKLLSKADSLEMLSIQLHQNTNLYCSDSKKLLVALTGGFDGRANLALLDKNPDDFLCYSYGMPGSRQVEVPKLIAEKLKINYTPVLLDEKYENEHDLCTTEAIEYSNGCAPILRSNYPFAYKNLNSYSKIILTGLFGSEVMRPLHNIGIMMNDYSEKLFMSDSNKDVLREILRDAKRKNYLKNNLIDDNSEELIEEIDSEYFSKFKSFDKTLRFFFFIIQEGIRKYFSQEIQIERVYVTTRFPFFDDDFVRLMYKTPFAGMYNGFLGKSKFKRRKGQLLYAYIYKKFKPELGKTVLDRGYKPDDLLKPFPLNFFSIYQGVKNTKSYKKLKGNDTFNSEKWTRNFINDSLNKYPNDSSIFGNGIKESYENKSYLQDLLKYSHFISLFKYFNTF
jgi:asparagine synthetase B (glutamine-hydrolysing)